MRLDYYLYAALQASESNEHAKAFFLLELCNEIDPDNPTVCSMRGAYMQSLYDKKTALPLLRKAYEGSPDDYSSCTRASTVTSTRPTKPSPYAMPSTSSPASLQSNR